MLDWFFTDEKTEAVQILKTGFTEKQFNGHEAYLISKYAYNELKYGDARTKRFLMDFCQKYDKHFNYILLRNSINKILKNANSDWKDKSNPIFITHSELNNIRKIRNFIAQKVILGFLVVAKKSDGYVNDNRLPDIKKMMHVNNSEIEMKRMIHLAYKENLIRDNNENYFVRFIDNSSEPVIKINSYKDLYNLENLYKDYCGGQLEYCKECKTEFIKQGSTNIYCENCSQKRRKDKVRNNVKKYRTGV